MSREATFTIPLRYIDVTRATSTTLEVMLDRRIDDCWNIEGDRDLSDSWTGFTRFTVLKEKPADGFSSSGERLTRKQTTSRPATLFPERWKKMSEAAQRKDKQKWAIEKPEFKETIYKKTHTKKVGSSNASSSALQNQRRKVQRNLSHFRCSQDKIRMHR